MEEIQRKSEKILGSKNYKMNKQEVRGESPNRKPLNPPSNKTTRLQSRNSTFNMTTTTPSTQNSSSQSKYRNATVN